MTTDRKNTRLAGAVELALSMARRRGPKEAARFLESEGASFALTCRVLGEPGQRRQRAKPG